MNRIEQQAYAYTSSLLEVYSIQH